MKASHDQSDSIFDVDYHNFDQQVIQASYKKPIPVDLWAQWCSPCLILAPRLKQLVDETRGAILLEKVEVDKGDGENMKLAGHYRVRGFSTVIIFY